MRSKCNLAGPKTALSWFRLAGLVIALVSIPGLAGASSASSTCIEDGGQADCTAPEIVDGPDEYQLQEYSLGDWITLNYFNSEQDVYNYLGGSSVGGCPTNQSPTPPYTWTVLPYADDGELISQSPEIHETKYENTTDCTHEDFPVFLVEKNQSVVCLAGWVSGLATATSNYPDGYCWRPRVQPCQKGQCTQAVGDPIEPALGNESESEVDYQGINGSPLHFVRTYNYAGAILGPGASLADAAQGWSQSYEQRLWFYPGGAIRALRPDGNTEIFMLVNGQYQEFGTAVDQLTALQSGGTATGWEFIDSDDAKEIYDTSGALMSITYRGGASVSMAYSTTTTPVTIAPYPGLLITVSDSFGHQLSFTYNSQCQIVTMTDPGGAVYSYSYSGSLLSAVQFPDSSSKQYLYNESAHTENANIPYALTGVIDENGSRYATIDYDSNGLAISSQLSGGVDHYTVSRPYTISGFATAGGNKNNTVTDPLGKSRTYKYAGVNGVAKFVGMSPGCPACADAPSAVTYDANGNVASKTDSNGNEILYSYDLTRNLETSRTEAYGTVQARTITTQWDPNWRQPDLITDPNHTVTYTYDSMGNALTKTVKDLATGTTRIWTYTYDSYGRVLTADGPRTDVSDVTTYVYYTCTTGSECGELDTVTDALGHVTIYNSYDGDGRPLTITDPNGVVTTLTYDARGRLKSRTVGSESTSFSYYPTGLLEQVTLSDGSSVSYTDDAAHRLTQINDGLGNKIVYTLDAMGNRTAENTYDPSGTLHRTHTRVINTLNEVYQEVNAAGTSAVTTTFGYDSDGNPTSIDAPLSRNTAESYDALNRVSSITDPGSGVTTFGYDAEDDLTSVQDPRKLTTSYGYDGFGDLTSQVSPDTGTTTNTYDSAGNLATSTDARGAVATYGYDALNRVTSIAYSLSGTTDQTLSFTYDQGADGIGHLTGASDANHSMSFSYDALSEMTVMSQTVEGVTRLVSYGYANGDLTSITTPSGQTVTYGYNANHQVTSIAVNGTNVLSNVSYEPFGPVDGWTWGDGAAFSRSFSGDGLITGISSPVSQETLSYDDASRISGITNTTTGSSNWTDGYDQLDRLTSASSSSVTEGWAYDPDGNRVSETGTTPSTYSLSSTSNEITGITGTLTRSYAYDAAGNTLSDSSDTDTYNDAGRLKTVTNGSGTTAFIYNALGQMIESSVASGITIYAYDHAGHLLGEYDGSGNLIQETVWLGDIPVATLRPNGSSVAIYYIVTDQLDTPREVVRSSDGAVMWSWFTGPFGVEAPNTNPQGAGAFSYDLRFPGQIAGAWGSSFQNFHRDYDPAVGRYVESDPIGVLASPRDPAMQIGLRMTENNGRDSPNQPDAGYTYIDPIQIFASATGPTSQSGAGVPSIDRLNAIYAYASGDPVDNIDPLGLAPPPSPTYPGTNPLTPPKKRYNPRSPQCLSVCLREQTSQCILMTSPCPLACGLISGPASQACTAACTTCIGGLCSLMTQACHNVCQR